MHTSEDLPDPEVPESHTSSDCPTSIETSESAAVRDPATGNVLVIPCNCNTGAGLFLIGEEADMFLENYAMAWAMALAWKRSPLRGIGAPHRTQSSQPNLTSR